MTGARPLLPSLIGATCSGKTSLAIAVAKRGELEIVSADSRQVYRRLDAGTAKPTAAERRAVPHHLIDVVEPSETYTAARFGREARAAAGEIRARGRTPFLVGGSGLYLRAAEEGLFAGPEADSELRRELVAEAEASGDEALHAKLAGVDPEAAARLHPGDRVRVIRALEVHAATGIPLSEHHRRHRESLVTDRLLRFGIEWPARLLERRIEARVERMLSEGWVEEVRRLLAEGVSPDAPAFRALGYAEVLGLVRGEIDTDEARRRVILTTRQFAKRQRTWFRRVENVIWHRVASEEELQALAVPLEEAIARAPESR
jgi:tRNA dimethylallyltransferase